MSEYFESIIADLPTIWLKGAIWSIAALLVVFTFRFLRVPAAGIRLFWLGNATALILIAAVEWIAPDWRIDASPVAPNLFTDNWSPLPPEAGALIEESVQSTVATSPISSPPSPSGSPSVPPVAFMGRIWALGVIVLLVILAKNLLRLRKSWRRAIAVTGAPATVVESVLGQTVPSRLAIAVKQSDEVTVPMAWGILRKKILLPTAIGSTDTYDFRRILLHEIHHLESHDPFWNLLSQIALLIHWPNFLVWHSIRQLRLAQEKSCDDRVLSATPGSTEAERYARLLVSFAKFSSSSPATRNDSVAFSITGRSSTLSRRIDSILDETMKRTKPTRSTSITALGIQVCLAGILGLIIFGDDLTAAERKENETLKKRINELENQVAELKSDTKEVVKQSKIDALVEENKQKARERMREDLGEYSQEELREIETLYQVANTNWRSEEARKSLEKLVDEYDDANRTGCALLYLAQYSEGEKREEYLRRVVEDFSDCYYGDGCQVGGYGRYLLVALLKEKGATDECAEIVKEIEKDYDTATSHRRQLIVEMVRELK